MTRFRRLLLLASSTICILSAPVEVYAQASPYALEILNIKPAGTGTPIISANHRLFRAYPGIEYNVRAAVIGGTYPYRYALVNAPSGMTINTSTGEISWPNPQVDSGVITLNVTDSAGARTSGQWQIRVTTSGFIFLNANYTGSEAGTLTQPYRTLQSMLAATSGRGTDIVYFRTGTYSLFNWQDVPGRMNFANNPFTWLAYPGEQPVIDGQNTYHMIAETVPVYFDGLTIQNVLNWGLIFSGPTHYSSIRRTIWRHITSDTSVNRNQGFIFSTGGGSKGYGLVIQDSTFSDFTGAQAIGSLYSGQKTLIENNRTFDGGKVGPHAFTTPIGLKARMVNTTVRGNTIRTAQDNSFLEIYNELEFDGLDFSYNLIYREGAAPKTTLMFYHPTNAYIYRNTFVGNVRFRPGDSQGPYFFSQNVLVGSLIDDTYVTKTNNLTGAETDNIVDSQGRLTSAYRQYLGSRGFELGPSTSPSKVPREPSSVSVR